MAGPYDNLQYAKTEYIPQYQGAPIEEFETLLHQRIWTLEMDYRYGDLPGGCGKGNQWDFSTSNQHLDSNCPGFHFINAGGYISQSYNRKGKTSKPGWVKRS